MNQNSKIKIRNLHDGEWFWVNKKIIQEHAPKIRAIGITVYCFLASLSDKNQFCYPSQKHVAESLGYSRSTINKALKRLEEHGLVFRVKKSPTGCGYLLLDIHKSLSEETDLSRIGNSCVAQGDTNKNNITRIINKKGIKNNSISFKSAFKIIQPKNRYELLALDIAEILGDYENFESYIILAKKYPESVLRKLLSEVNEIPQNSIKTSRANIFKYLIKQYEQKTNHNFGNQPGS